MRFSEYSFSLLIHWTDETEVSEKALGQDRTTRQRQSAPLSHHAEGQLPNNFLDCDMREKGVSAVSNP